MGLRALSSENYVFTVIFLPTYVSSLIVDDRLQLNEESRVSSVPSRCFHSIKSSVSCSPKAIILALFRPTEHQNHPSVYLQNLEIYGSGL